MAVVAGGVDAVAPGARVPVSELVRKLGGVDAETSIGDVGDAVLLGGGGNPVLQRLGAKSAKGSADDSKCSR